MFSSQFLSSYCFFTAAVSAYRNTSEDARTAPEQKDVVKAFKKATQEMSFNDRSAFVTYVQCLLQLPQEFEREEYKRHRIEQDLDNALRERRKGLIKDETLITIDDLVNRTAMSETVVSQKLRERRIFSLPFTSAYVGREDYFPAFFADPRYDQVAIEAVSMALREEYGIRKFRFFITPDSLLENRTPLMALMDGDLEKVLVAVKAFRKRMPVR